jgi:hypothetical protein
VASPRGASGGAGDQRARSARRPPITTKKPRIRLDPGPWKTSGGDLLSHRASPAVPSALEVLTSEFEMGSGVTPPVRPPKCDVQSRALDGSELSTLTRVTLGRASVWVEPARVTNDRSQGTNFCLECRNQAAHSKNFDLNQIDGALQSPNPDADELRSSESASEVRNPMGVLNKKKSNGGQAARPISTG